MSIINRYKFTKDIYSNYIIFIRKKRILNTYFIDNKICMELNIKKYYQLDKYQINYLILDNLDINIKKEYSINNYNKYLIIYLIKEIGNNLKEKVNYEKENNI
ncbi:MAG: hypothetical protein ACI312_00300 [Bacilli bacterium]